MLLDEFSSIIHVFGQLVSSYFHFAENIYVYIIYFYIIK